MLAGLCAPWKSDAVPELDIHVIAVRSRLLSLCDLARACAMSSAISCEVVSRPLSSNTTTRSCGSHTAQQRSAQYGKVSSSTERHLC